MNLKESPNFIKAVGLFLPALLFVVVAVALSSLISNKINKPNSDTQNPPRIIVSCPADFTSYSALVNGEGKIVDLVSKKVLTYAANGDFINSKVVITKNETATSKVACGYLYVKAATDQGSLKSWEHLYINPNEFGGHIDSSNQIGPGDSNNYSEYVFPLNKIQYWSNLSAYAQNDLSVADWSALLNVSPKVEFWIGFSTNNPTGYIEKLSIVYKCWDPATGKENKGCNLDVVK